MTAAPETSASRAQAMRALAADRVAAELVMLLTGGGVDVILLKGSPSARWLYPPGHVRPVQDVDLLIAPWSVDKAEQLLGAAGWVHKPNPFVTHATTWIKDGTVFPLDLHTSFHFVRVSPETFWTIAIKEADKVRIGGTEVVVPNRRLATTLLGLHASAWDSRAAAEFELALRTSSDTHLLETVELARELGAADELAVSLRRSSRGVELAEALSLAVTMSDTRATTTEAQPRTARGFMRLDQATNLTGLGKMLVRELVPNPRQIRRCYPRLARNPGGLLLGYLWRPIDVLVRAPAGWRAWWRLRRRVDVSWGRVGTLERVGLGGEILFAYAGCRVALRRQGVVRAAKWARSPLDGLSGRVMQSPSVDITTGRRIGEIVGRVLQRVPGDTRCLVRSLVVMRLLSARGIRSDLALAVRHQDPAAHAWIEVQGQAVSDQATGEFVRVTTL